MNTYYVYNITGFGSSLSFDYTGKTLAISAPYSNSSSKSTGGVYIYQRDANNDTFTQYTSILLGRTTPVNAGGQAFYISMNANASILLTSGTGDNCTYDTVYYDPMDPTLGYYDDYFCYGAVYTFTPFAA